jgi:Mrp family chromosome partitioning ATPase
MLTNGNNGGKNADAQHNKDQEAAQQLKENLDRIAHKIVVLSGKGGVGKSTVAANLAATLASQGAMVGLLDIDIHGPSIPTLLHLEGKRLTGDGDEKLYPIEYSDNLKVISIGFLLQKADDAVIWRGPLKFSAIRQFLKDVLWGDLDYLIIDSPPGTGDEPLSVCQMIENADGAVIVTTPQDLAISDVRKSISFCRSLKMPVIGVIENMSGFTCPHCGETVNIFSKGGGEKMAAEMDVRFLGSIPIDTKISDNGDTGTPFSLGESGAVAPFRDIVETIKRITEKNGGN